MILYEMNQIRMQHSANLAIVTTSAKVSPDRAEYFYSPAFRSIRLIVPTHNIAP